MEEVRDLTYEVKWRYESVGKEEIENVSSRKQNVRSSQDKMTGNTKCFILWIKILVLVFNICLRNAVECSR